MLLYQPGLNNVLKTIQVCSSRVLPFLQGSLFASDSPYYLWLVPILAHTIIVSIINLVYSKVAEKCTDLENHRYVHVDHPSINTSGTSPSFSYLTQDNGQVALLTGDQACIFRVFRLLHASLLHCLLPTGCGHPPS